MMNPCPKCGGRRFSIGASIPVRLDITVGGADDEEEFALEDTEQCGDTEWSSTSTATCRNEACGWVGTVTDIESQDEMVSAATGCTCIGRHDGGCAFAQGGTQERDEDAEVIAQHTVNMHMDTEDLARLIKRITGSNVSPDLEDLLRDLTNQQVGIVRVEMDLIAACARSQRARENFGAVRYAELVTAGLNDRECGLVMRLEQAIAYLEHPDVREMDFAVSSIVCARQCRDAVSAFVAAKSSSRI